MPLFAIMQGRLLPPQDGRFQCFPRNGWRDEFTNAREAGLDAIEWIYDVHGADVNPLTSEAGIAEMLELGRSNGIAVVSLCADYFMDRPFVTATEGEFAELSQHLGWLIGQCQQAGIGRMVLPFVDASRIQSAEQEDKVVEMFRGQLETAAAAGVELHLETAFGPSDFAAMLAKLPHPMIKANYDSGNSSSLGYDVREEFAAYGPRVGSVHIKDRIRGGSTVPLGTGDADLPALFSLLTELPYTGDYVLQVARSEAGKETGWAKENLAWVKAALAAAQPAEAI